MSAMWSIVLPICSILKESRWRWFKQLSTILLRLENNVKKHFLFDSSYMIWLLHVGMFILAVLVDSFGIPMCQFVCPHFTHVIHSQFRFNEPTSFSPSTSLCNDINSKLYSINYTTMSNGGRAVLDILC